VNVISDKYKYERIKLRDPEGKVHYSANSADAVARALLGMTQDQLIKVLQTNALDHVIPHKAKNAGQFRMIVGGALRARIAKGEHVRIGPYTVSDLKQDVPWPEGWRQEPVIRKPLPEARVVFRDKYK